MNSALELCGALELRSIHPWQGRDDISIECRKFMISGGSFKTSREAFFRFSPALASYECNALTPSTGEKNISRDRNPFVRNIHCRSLARRAHMQTESTGREINFSRCRKNTSRAIKTRTSLGAAFLSSFSSP
jgi:hypothetical protein